MLVDVGFTRVRGTEFAQRRVNDLLLDDALRTVIARSVNRARMVVTVVVIRDLLLSHANHPLGSVPACSM